MIPTRGDTVRRPDTTGRPAPPPVTWTVVATLVGAGAALFAVLFGIGVLITRALADSELVGGDSRVSRWFLRNRTPTFDTLTDIGSTLADTMTAIALTAVLMVVFRVWLGRWRESLVVLASIAGELFVFLLVTNAIDRKRPPVPKLDPAPPTSSFPSGHTAAAVALYGCLAVVLLRHLAARRLAVVLAIVCWCVPLVVAVSRLYRGMHYPSDVLFGFLGGATWLIVVVMLLMPRASQPPVSEGV
jgi:undecaprenyl-diphosphatase